MPRCIDADLIKTGLKQEFCIACSGDYENNRQCCAACDIAYTMNLIDETPTADVKPVIYGHWIYGECGNDKYIKCSFCRKIIVNNIVTLEGDIAETAFVLCPYCGAKNG